MTTEGTDFFLTFMSNFEHEENSAGLQLKLIASSREATTVTVTNPQTGWSKSFTVAANTIAECAIPAAQGYLTATEKTEKKGLRITSTAPISLYASNYADATNDATGILPLTALGGYYIIQTYESTQYPKEFAVVATEDNTSIVITPHARTLSGKNKNIPFTIHLNKGEAYQVGSSDETSDLSGTSVQASRPVAVFAGHRCANVAAADDWCDHIVEQQMPTSLWGKRFAVTKAIGQYTNRVQITAQYDNTSVSVNGTLLTTLRALQTYEFRLEKEDLSCFVETSEPAACYLYTEGGRRNNKVGDPSSVHISPIEQFINEITFATLKTPRSVHNYVNIVTPTATADRTTLDGSPIQRTFTPLDGNPNLSYVRMEVPHGTHTIANPDGGLTAYVYGLGDGESYAYMVGSSTFPLDAQILVDGRPGAQQALETFCRRHTFSFAPQVNMAYTSVHWDFGDGIQITQEKPQHIYSSEGVYTITMTVTGESQKQTVTTTLRLKDQLRDTVRATICKGDKYAFNGKNYSEAGNYPVSLICKDGCDSIVVLVLSVADTYRISETRYIAEGQTVKWRGQRLSEPKTYRDTLPTIFGCDSIFELTLIQTTAPKEQFDTLCYEPTYLFMGHEYPIPPVDQYKHLKYVPYTLEYRDNLTCEKYKMHLAIVPQFDVDSVLYDTIAAGATYPWRGQTYSETGTYNDEEELACYSTKHYTLHLFVKPYPIEKESATLCKTGSYDFHGKTITEPGEYADTLFTAVGIGAIYQLTLTDQRSVKELYVDNVSSYDFHGKTLTASGTYRDTLTNKAGCDSIVILYLGIDGKCTVNEEISEAVCEGETIEWHDQTCSPGKDYTYTTTSTAGCDSVVILHLAELKKKQTHVAAEICEGDYYRVGETRLTEEGSHSVHLLSAEGCDSLVLVNLSVLPPLTGDTFAYICPGSSITWHDITYDKADDYSHTYVSKLPPYCDSIVTLHLIELRATDSITTAVICHGEQFTWHGKTYTDNANEKEILTNAAGCDSVCELHLTVHPSYNLTDEEVIRCEGEQYEWEGTTYTKTTTDTKYLQTVHGCDSTVTRTFTFHPTYDITDEEVIRCEGEQYEWEGTTYTKTTTDTKHLQTVHGCDSTVTRTFTFNPKTSSTETKFLFTGETYDWNGKTYSESGNYEYHTDNRYGCDSTAYLYLTVSDKPVKDSTEAKTICAGESFEWQGQTVTPTETNRIFTHRITGDETDTLITLTVTVYPSYPNEKEEHTMCSGETYEWEGDIYTESTTVTKTLQTQNGCDSIVTLYLTVHSTYDITDEEVIRCEGESYEWEGTTYTKTTTDTKHLQTIHGCDSSVTRTFTFNPKTSSTETKFLFTGETYDWNGKIYSESGNFEYHTDNRYGCDSTAYLYLTVSDKPVKDSAETKTICAGESFEWQGQTLTPTETNRIFTYRLTGEETDTLITLTVTVYPSYPNEKEEHTMCSGETFEWEGDIYTESTTVTKTLQTKNGCDSIVTLYLTVYPSYNLTDEEVIRCEGEQYEWEGTTYTKTTTDTKHLQTVHGCDSTVTRTFTFNPKTSSTETKFLFTGETYDWNGKTYSASGNFEYHTDNQYGCDSTAYLYLTVSDKPVKDSTEAKTICAGESFEWQGQTVTPTETNRIFTHRITGEETDTLITLTVTVYPTYNLTDEEVIRCEGESYEWEGTTYTKTTTDTKHLQTIHGCDSTVTRTFTFHPTYPNEEFTATICANEQYEWEGDTYSEAGDYTKRLTSIYGCDSVVTLHLQVGKTYYAEVDSTICAGETCVWNGETYTQTGDYEQPLVSKGGCDSIVTLHLTVLEPVYKETKDLLMEGQTYTWNGVEYTTAGDYEQTFTAANGCDSVVTLHLAFNRLVLTASVADHCADDPTIDFVLRVSEGAMEQVGFAFGEKEQAQGYRDTMVTYVEDTIRIPNRARAGHYSTTLTYYYKGQPIRSEQMTYTLLYPSSVLEQNWDDFIGVLTHDYNGGYDFTAFQWYENGQVMTGRTRSYIYDCVVQGYRYSALLTETDGTQLMTCELVASHRDELTVYPTLLHRRQAFRVRSSESAVLQLYDATGKHVGTYHTDGGEIELNAPPAAGLFLLYVEQDGKEKVTPVKLIVR
ncbi:MAG: PKD domain-containing protein [Paludibacteraceae bacterium]|nr:PKD domain-containing protein [Paludibacteraceae bacterium]